MDPARVQRVHLHPLKFCNGCNAAVLKWLRVLGYLNNQTSNDWMTVYILIDQFQIMRPSSKTLHQSLHLKNKCFQKWHSETVQYFYKNFSIFFISRWYSPWNSVINYAANWHLPTGLHECSLQKIGTFIQLCWMKMAPLVISTVETRSVWQGKT